MSQEERKVREYTAEFKLAAVKRVLSGEGVSLVADELGMRRKRLYVWKDRYLQFGEAGLAASKGGRPRSNGQDGERGAEPQAGRGELLAARKRIAELERKVGQQELELDFFGEALRRSTKPVDAKKSTR
jgi:transposase